MTTRGAMSVPEQKTLCFELPTATTAMCEATSSGMNSVVVRSPRTFWKASEAFVMRKFFVPNSRWMSSSFGRLSPIVAAAFK